MSTLTLTAASPVQTFTEPLSLSDLKSYLSLTEDSTDDDYMLSGFIPAARDVFEIEQGKDLVVKQWDLTLDYFYDCHVHLRERLISVDLVTRRDSDGTYTTMTEGTDYIVDIPRGIITTPYGTSWPSYTAYPTGSVLIRFTAGIPSTDVFWNGPGARILTGMKVLIKSWYIGDDSTWRGNQTGIPWAASVLAKYGSIPRVG